MKEYIPIKPMAVARNNDSKQMKKDSNDKVNKLKHEVLTEDEAYKWLVNNK